MSEVTRILAAIEQGDPSAAEQLLPLVYEELRQLAAQRLAQEKPGQTLQATALVHEAYLRLVAAADSSGPREQHWNSRGHFFGAAAEAMRRILVEAARKRGRQKRGGKRRRLDLDAMPATLDAPHDDVEAVSEALDTLAQANPQAAQLVKLRYFVGLTGRETAEILGMSPRKADQVWAYARAWLHERLNNP